MPIFVYFFIVLISGVRNFRISKNEPKYNINEVENSLPIYSFLSSLCYLLHGIFSFLILLFSFISLPTRVPFVVFLPGILGAKELASLSSTTQSIATARKTQGEKGSVIAVRKGWQPCMLCGRRTRNNYTLTFTLSAPRSIVMA